MKEILRIAYNDLCVNIDHQSINIDKKNLSLFGQEKAIEALEFGLQINSKGYNIFLAGETGINKEKFIQHYLKTIASKQPIPNDWCYVYNFEDELNPIAISLPAGEGIIFKENVKHTIENLIEEINRWIDSEEYKEVKDKIKEEYYNEGELLLNNIKDRADSLGFYPQISESGFYFIPIIEGKKISEKAYDDLTVEEQEKIISNLSIIEEESEKIMEQVKDIKAKSEKKIEALEEDILHRIIDNAFIDSIKNYNNHNKIKKFLEDLKKDLTKDIYELIDTKETESEDLKTLISSLTKEKEDLPKKYEVNLFVDNSCLKGAPVIYCYNPTFNNIVGKVEFDNELGNLVTDFTKIKCGALHQANGGYLILNIKEVLNNTFVWDYLKKTIINETIEYENIREKLGGIPLTGLKPEEISLSTKIILMGSQSIYELLYYYDEDFEDLFKVLVEVEEDIIKDEKNMNMLLNYMDDYVKKNNLYPLNYKAKEKLLFYAIKMSGNKNKISTKVKYIENIIQESNYWCKKQRKKVIGEEHTTKAIMEKDKRISLIKEKVYEMIQDNKIKIDIEGSAIGQINGLAIMKYGEVCFAKPTRITATTYMGQSGMINIEKEAGLSGAIHSKGINILAGYLGQKYAQDSPLSLSCRICFEQNYSGIDGDSASSTELYAILSSLAQLPIKQYLAVTGSVDQKGNIQPIGGVIEKVEGFYDICKLKGFNNRQGVMIPKDNLEELILRDDILEDIKNKKFHIYAISTIEEGIELLTDKKIEEIDLLINTKLQKYYKNSIK
ncbi:putative ATP-dependent protease [Natranaerovirga hydrolytica]|uniref:endopeptidase La n=1 Tax=Natranaerovirga hydrolytica TaxID=680378 RepID=A0A4R1M6Q2_9FIRM|nr:ATP-binding protein [Natranaerovirga hydrolytica]TCK87938.1 putative ATP-dependent protease [Natranaerovirga hydrolytica]